MSDSEKSGAEVAWSEACAAEVEKLSADAEDAYGLCAIRKYVADHLKLRALDLHDACILLGERPLETPSMMSYLNILYTNLGDASRAFQPQCARSHTKAALADVLRCLKRGGAKLSLLFATLRRLG